MSRVFWDTMLFIYLVENHPKYFGRCRDLLERSYQRDDLLFTSYLVLGEVLAGAAKSPDPAKSVAIRDIALEMSFTPLPFDGGSLVPFGSLRTKQRLPIADAINLASAASAGVDLFLTGDKRLAKVHQPGIQFIADFQTEIL